MTVSESFVWSDPPPLVVQTECDLFPFSPIAREVVISAGLRYEGVPAGQDHLVSSIARLADAVIVSGFTADLAFIDSLERCKVIARCGVGIDSVDVERAHERGILVTYVPDFCTVEVAEHTLALILACERRVALCDRSIRSGRWPRYTELAPIRRLQGMTVGIVGFGRIGRKLALLAEALDMRAVAYDPLLDSKDMTETTVQLLPLDEFLPQADVLSLHLPLTSGTRRWLDSDKLGELPAGATVVNTARGGVIDEQALLSALESGAVRAAGLDVFESEPEGLNAQLIAHPNVVSTPHSAALSERSLAELFRSAAEDVLRVLSDGSPIHPVRSSALAQ
jgi:D-3-phosphoglycerate dehydrogenase